MKLAQFDAPGRNGDFAGNAALAAKWSADLSKVFDEGVADVTRTFQGTTGVSQFYNPVTANETGPDVPAAIVTWNGFPRKFLGAGPGVPPNFKAAEAPVPPGKARPQDEYIEWHTVRNAAGKITSIQLTTEGWDYYEFLGATAPSLLLKLYKKYISPSVKKADLFASGEYNKFNKWNTAQGAMHLTDSANTVGAAVILAAQATVRRKGPTGAEITAGVPLTKCAQFGDERRNSDPAIGGAINGLVRQGRKLTLADPVGLYIDSLDDAAFRLPDGAPTTGWFQIQRGAPGFTVRAVFQPPAGSPFTVSDVTIGGEAVEFGGQIVQHITMKVIGVASEATGIANPVIGCVGAGTSGVITPSSLSVAAPAHSRRG